jgi:hypothetical protein
MSHTFPFADKGRSWVKVSIEYPHEASPTDVTPVNVKVDCWPSASFRRILSVDIKIITATNTVSKITPREPWKGPTTTVTFTEDEMLSATGTFTGAVGVVWSFLTCSLGVTKTTISETKIGRQAAVDTYDGVLSAPADGDSDTVEWAISAAEIPGGVGLRGPLSPEVNLSYTLLKKPDKVTFECVVVHKSHNGSRRTVSPRLRSRPKLFPFWHW